MGRGKDLNDEEKKQIIKLLATSTSLEDIAKKISRHLVTVKRFLHDPIKKRKTRSDRGILKSATKRYLRTLKRNLRKAPGAISKRIFEQSGSTAIPKTTRNRILGQIAKHKASSKRPPLSSRHKNI
jgi:IS30 family transposase